MKKFNRIIISSIIIYCVLAFLSGSAILRLKQHTSQEYMVEINRIVNEIKTKEDIQSIDIEDYTFITKIDFLAAEVQEQKQLNQFYTASNNETHYIHPLYQDNYLLGYLKINYQRPPDNINLILFILEISLFVLEGIVVLYLLYLKKHLITPFQKLSDIPLQLSRGHLKGTIKEEKSKYFGQFIWGIGQLKDTLDISKKRQLELMSEKKKLLLSLSHDIKTPLNVIKLYSKAISEDIYEDDATKKQALLQITKKAFEIEEYVNEIIKSSREDLFDLKVNNTDFYLQDLMDNVISVYQEQCTYQNIDLIIDAFDNRLLKGDIERSQEVIENLFENAFKYGDGRRIEISFYEEDYCQLIRFYNTGIQIEENEINHIFDSFFRASNAQGKAGSGLGLYICRELMRKMDGDIFVEKAEQGMAFVLVFR